MLSDVRQCACGAGGKAPARVRLLDVEDDWLDKLDFEVVGLVFVDDEIRPKLSVKQKIDEMRSRLDAVIGQWVVNLEPVQKGGVATVGLYIQDNLTWDSKSDLLLARVIGLLVGKELRAHPDSAYRRGNGSWQPCKVLPEDCAVYVEKSLAYARFLFDKNAREPGETVLGRCLRLPRSFQRMTRVRSC